VARRNMTGNHYAHRRAADQRQGLHYSDFRARIASKCLNGGPAPPPSASESRTNPRGRARFTRCHVIVESDACSYVEQSMRIWRYAQGLLRTMPHKAVVAIIRSLRPWARRARTRLHQPARTGRSPRPSLGPPLERALYFAPTRTIGEAAGGDRADAELDAHGAEFGFLH